jgi:DNA-binding IclR family transcriptional regulator
MSEISLTGDQMLTVLLEVAHHGPVTSTEVARGLNINRTIVYRLLTTLERRGFVIKDESSYSLGPVANQLAGINTDLTEIAEPFLNTLSAKIGESVVMHKIVGQEALVIAEVPGKKHQVRVHQELGERHSLALGASGRVLLAFSKPSLQTKAIESAKHPVALKNILREVRELGYAISHDELKDGVHGLAVPVLGKGSLAFASTAVLVPTVRSKTLLSCLDDLRGTALRIEKSFNTSNG